MKKHLARLLAAAGLVCLLSGCASRPAPAPITMPAQDAAGSAAPVDLTAGAAPAAGAQGELTERAAAAMTDFAVRLLQNTEDGGRLLSPLSVLYALGMTANGAKGETKAQLEQALGLSTDELNRALYACRQTLPAPEDGAFDTANSVWVRDEKGMSVEDGFLSAASSYYGAEIFRAAFGGSTLYAINGWVREHTDGMIPEILDQIPDSAMLYLINAVAFKADWAEPYADGAVADAVFTTDGGAERTVAMMRSEENLYLEDGQAEGFVKLYKGGRYAFAALLPDEGVRLADYVASLTGESLRRTLRSAQSVTVDAGLPKFTADFGTELSRTLRALGVTDLFNPDAADLSGMAGCQGGNIAVSGVLHKTHIEVDEQGTKAAAATAVEAAGCTALEREPKRVILDRPFVYLLIDTQNDLPLFIGVAADPGNS